MSADEQPTARDVFAAADPNDRARAMHLAMTRQNRMAAADDTVPSWIDLSVGPDEDEMARGCVEALNWLRWFDAARAGGMLR